MLKASRILLLVSEILSIVLASLMFLLFLIFLGTKDAAIEGINSALSQSPGSGTVDVFVVELIFNIYLVIFIILAGVFVAGAIINDRARRKLKYVRNKKEIIALAILSIIFGTTPGVIGAILMLAAPKKLYSGNEEIL